MIIFPQILRMLFSSLSLIPFTLLNLEWIATTTTRLFNFANVKETSTYDFIVIGGGNA